jgi:5-methylcytosine-specific restriction endonuclease McrA
MGQATCSIPDCDDPVAIKKHGWCSAHCQRYWKWGDPLGGGPRRIHGRIGCEVAGCPEPHCANGLCRPHYEQARQQRRYAENPEYFKEQAKRWQAENRERYRARKQQFHLENPHVSRERNQRYYKANKEDLKAAARVYEKAHAEKGRARRRRRKALLKSYAIGSITPELLAAKFAYWGNHCWLCGGEPETVDHVKPLRKGGAHCLANLRPACASCNSSKKARWPARHRVGPAWRMVA